MKKAAFPSKILFHKRDIRRVKGRQIVDKKRCSEPIHARTRYWTRRQRLRAKCRELNSTASRSLKGLEDVARFLGDLHLPFLDPRHLSGLSDEQILTRLRWVFDSPDRPREGHICYSPEQEAPLLQYSREDGPGLDLPPTCAPQKNVHWKIVHLYEIWEDPLSLPLPTYWPPFSNVDWEQKLFVSQETDSTRSHASFDSCDIDIIAMESDNFSIHTHSCDLLQPRLRYQWELLTSMYPASFRWTFQTEEAAKRRDHLRHAGRLDFNQPSFNKDIWPQSSTSAFLQLWEFGDYYQAKSSTLPISELGHAKKFGRLITKIVATDLFPAEHRKVINWPLLLSQGIPTVTVDYTCCSNLGYKNVPALLFAAQYKSGDFQDAVQLLARAFQPMMTLFILYYLDTRASRDAPMPWWMVLFGITYDEDGISVHSFFPSFKLPSEKGSQHDEDIGWYSNSWNINTQEAMRQAPYKRSTILGILIRLQGHCRHVLEQLNRWDGYGRIISRMHL